MISIGPYVVVREIPTRHSQASGESGAGRTYRATDRLTGIPVLLHSQPTMNIDGLPSLPPHPSLLPFTDVVVNAGEAYLVTELPPNAVPAREPTLAARGALTALTALHESGLAHGHLNTAQVWSVDGPVRLAGGGRHALDSQYTVARDLRELALTLEELGGLPPILSLLRTEPERLSAREALQLLQSGELPPSVRNAAPQGADRGVRFTSGSAGAGGVPSLPNLDPLSLTDLSAPLPQSAAFMQQAVLTTRHEPTSSNTDPGVRPANQPGGQPTGQPANLPFKLDVSQWHAPDFLTEPAPDTSETQPTRTASLGWAEVARPLEQSPAPAVTTTPDLTPPPPEENGFTRQGRKARAAASQAFNRLRADGQRQRQLQEVKRNEVAAQLGDEQATSALHDRTALAEGAEELPIPDAVETPQERRERETQARMQEEELARQLNGQRGDPLPPAPRPRPAPQTALEPAEKRQLKGMKLRWDDKTNSWQKAQPPEQRTAPGSGLPVWVWPALLLALLLTAMIVQRARTASPSVQPLVNAGECCNVNFQVKGGNGQAEISILNTTSRREWTAGQRVGSAPGTLHLPGEGTYKLNVAAPGFTPAVVEVTVPTAQPVTISLGQ